MALLFWLLHNHVEYPIAINNSFTHYPNAQFALDSCFYTRRTNWRLNRSKFTFLWINSSPFFNPSVNKYLRNISHCWVNNPFLSVHIQEPISPHQHAAQVSKINSNLINFITNLYWLHFKVTQKTHLLVRRFWRTYTFIAVIVHCSSNISLIDYLWLTRRLH